MTAGEEVEAATVALIDAFAANDRPRYFASFLPEATFVFPIVDRVLASRADLTLHERETIIFRRVGGKWLAVHEHVSPLVVEPPA